MKLKKDEIVAIAKDVIDTLTIGKKKAYTVMSSLGYIVSDMDDRASVPDCMLNAPAKKTLVKLQKDCTVCAQGAMVIEWAKKMAPDNITASQIMADEIGEDMDSAHEISMALFGENNALLIETAFESTGVGFDSYRGLIDSIMNDNDYTPSQKRAKLFGAQYFSDEKRLIAIMENVIENDGVFKP